MAVQIQDSASSGRPPKETYLEFRGRWFRESNILSKFGNSDFRWHLERLITKCIDEAVRCKDDDISFFKRLDLCHSILYRLWGAYYEKRHDKFRATIAEKNIINRPNEYIPETRFKLWSRINPDGLYYSGRSSYDFVDIDRDSIRGAAYEYLSCKWLQDNEIEWIILDMFVTSEIIGFQEGLKMNYIPIGTNSDIYFACNGEIDRMKAEILKKRIARFGKLFLVFIILPIIIIGIAISYSYFITSLVISSIFAAILCIASLFFLGRRLFKRLSGEKNQETKMADDMLDLRIKMLDAWRSLEGPVVHPKRVKEALRAAADSGGVWENTAWAIVDMAIARDPSVWLVVESEK